MSTRRELLMMAPAAALAAFAVPDWRTALLSKGQTLTDAAAERFHSSRLAPQFPRSALTDPAHFPLNSYLADEPGHRSGYMDAQGGRRRGAAR